MSPLKGIVKKVTHADAPWIYFEERAQALLKKPQLTRRDLAYVSSRDYRVWTDEVYDDMIDSYVSTLALDKHKTVLEVGCAAGFIASGLSPRVRGYIGVDLSPTCLKIGKRLNLPNAQFLRGNGTSLPVPDHAVDCVLCADVFVNIGDPKVCELLIKEMARVLVPGGKILIATLNDATASQASFQSRIKEFMASLPPYEEDTEVSQRRWMPLPQKVLYRLRRRVVGVVPDCAPSVVHEPSFFMDTASRIGLACAILPVHRKHPYHGFRFNALLTQRAA